MIRKYELLLERKHIPLSSCQDIRDLYDSFVLEEVKMNNPDEVPDGLYFRDGRDGSFWPVFPPSPVSHSLQINTFA